MTVPHETRLVVISPHLDDAVMGCGQLLAARPGAAVITVFAGRPASYAALTSWDRRAGHGPGNDVVGARWEEDRAALALLGARPIWLEFVDTQYAAPPAVGSVTEAVERAIVAAEAEVVVMPLGLFHSDHEQTHQAAIAVFQGHPELAWFAYEEAIYRRRARALPERLAGLRAAGISVEPAGCSDAAGLDLKRRALACYGSQLRALATTWAGGYDDAFEPEAYWRLTRSALSIPTPTRRSERERQRC